MRESLQNSVAEDAAGVPPVVTAVTRVIAGSERPFVLESGDRLAPVELAYETYGELAADGANAVLVCHPLTLDAHASGIDAAGRRGWFDEVIGPGRCIDTDKWFVVCSNSLGGCSGSTGPTSAAGNSHLRTCGFPPVTVRDMVRAQRLLLDQLGVRRLALVLGGSTGGMQALEWTLIYPDLVERACVIATSAGPSPLRLGFSAVTRGIFELGGAGGDPKGALRVARKLAMINYRSEEEFDRRFGSPAGCDEIRADDRGIEAYLEHHGRMLVERFDVDSYRTLLGACDTHDVGRERGGIAAALATVRAPVLCIGITSDRLYPAAEVREIARRIPRGRYRELDLPNGHDSFLIHTDAVASALADWELFDAQPSSSVESTPRSAPRGVPRLPAGDGVVRLGLFGYGTVGRGVFSLLAGRQNSPTADRVRLAGICVRNSRRAVAAGAPASLVVTDARELLDDVTLDVIVELIGGEHEALQIITGALRSAQTVITANKLVVARHLPALRALVERHGGQLLYGAAVCGSIPVLKIIDETLESDTIVSIRGIVNGSTNYILSQMCRGRSYEQVLDEARRSGFLEADASADLLGYDSAQKLSILAYHAFGVHVHPDRIPTGGIDVVDERELRERVAAGQTPKLIAEARQQAGGLELIVELRYLDADDRLAGVADALNAVEIEGENVGRQCYIGAGAGSLPTATAVMSDLFDVLRRGSHRRSTDAHVLEAAA